MDPVLDCGYSCHLLVVREGHCKLKGEVAILTKPPTPQIRLIKISPHLNHDLNHDLKL